MDLDDHPTVRRLSRHVQEVEHPPQPKLRLDGAWLRRLAVECGADDAGIVDLARPALDPQRDEILQPTGLRSTQVVLLVLLAAEHECSLPRLARQLVLSPSTLSRSLQPLVRDGLVALVQAGRRGKRVRLTPAGHHALRAAVPYWHQAQERFLRLVGPESWTQVNERLAQIVVVTRA